MKDIKNRLIIGITLISIILIGCLIYKINQTDYEYESEKNISYMMSLNQLTDHVENVENFLAKSTISSSPEAGAESLSTVWKEAEISVSYLSQIPLNIEQLNKTAKFLNQVSEYSYSLSRKNIYQEKLTQEELDNLKMLHKYSVELKDNLNEILEELNLGMIAWEDLVDNNREYIKEVGNISFVDIDNNFNEFEGLIYDGAFSEHIELAEKKGLTGEKISEEQAENKIKEILKNKIKKINRKGKITEGNIEVYRFELEENNGISEISISTQGGKIVLYNKDRDVEEEKISREEANTIGKEFLKNIGFENMQESYYQTQENIITINYLYKQDNISVYPDLIKLKIALDTGEILGVESTGYLNSHQERTDIIPKISIETAKNNLNKNLEIKSQDLAIIPTEWKTEILCYEFKGQIDETEFLVYINAKTGKEENILVIKETPGGILTM